jgi:hypothetical protein
MNALGRPFRIVVGVGHQDFQALLQSHLFEAFYEFREEGIDYIRNDEAQ